REVTDLDVVDMLDDSVTLASSSPRALPELRGHARGDVVEVGPARPEKGDLALAVSVAHLFLFGSRRLHRDPVEVRHADTGEPLDDNGFASARELVREVGKRRDGRVSRAI